jgi:hypothetical protein
MALIFSILNLIPTMVVAFIAATRTDTTLWSDMSRGMAWGWAIGVLTWALVTGFLFLLAEMLLGVRTTEFRIELLLGIGSISFLAAIGVQYHLVIHYFRSQIQDRVGWEQEPRFRAPERRFFSFSLKTLLIAQVLLIMLIGVWIGARRKSILQVYEERRVRAERIAKSQTQFPPNNPKP